jgi:hypothetical protein
MRKLEALADSIIAYNGSNDPMSPLYKGRNPCGLKAFADKHTKDALGNRTFKTWLDGYQALLFDLKVKCGGKSHNKALTPQSNLAALAKSLYMAESTGPYLAKFLKKALDDESITKDTHIGTFMEVE